MKWGSRTFQQAVKLILVGNEALVANAAGHENTDDLINAIIAIKALLTTKGVAAGRRQRQWGGHQHLCANRPDVFAGPDQLLVQEFTPGAPVVENIYPFQFGDAPTDLSRNPTACLGAAHRLPVPPLDDRRDRVADPGHVY